MNLPNTVLIVDDDESMRISTKMILRDQGFLVDTAGDGREALEKSKNKPYNLVLLDITLPDILGVDLLPYVKNLQPNAEIIMATAYGTLETAIKAINNGASAYITKPFNIEGMLQTIQHSLEKQRLRAENQQLLENLQKELQVREQVEDALRQSQNELEIKVKERTRQLTIANQELEQFVYSSYHDLRSPVRAIKLYSELALKRASDPEETKEYLQAIRDESDRLFKLLDSILIHGRLGKFAENLSPVRVIQTIQEVVTKLQPQIKEIQANVQVPEDDATLVIGNPTLLNQIFTNLLDNALKYRTPGTATQVSVTISQNEEWVFIDVSDNGIGIQEEYFEKIFQIFQRLHSSEEYFGAGIGLATVKKSAELMNGHVSVRSVVNQGTTFQLQLPKALPAQRLSR